MAIRDKTELTEQINTLLQDNDEFDIEASEVRSVLQDVVDSFALLSDLTPGAAGTGMPSFGASNLVYEEAEATIRGNVLNYAGDLPVPSFVAFIAPMVLPRAADPLKLALNTPGANGLDLKSNVDEPVAARDLTPNCIHLALRGGNYRLLDPLGAQAAGLRDPVRDLDGRRSRGRGDRGRARVHAHLAPRGGSRLAERRNPVRRFRSPPGDRGSRHK